MENAHPTACALLGLEAPAGFYSGRPNPISIAVETAPTARLTVISLAVLLGAAEDGTSRTSWRNPTYDTRDYFTALAGWGYPLSRVEQLVCHPDDRDTVDDETGEEAEAEVVDATTNGEDPRGVVARAAAVDADHGHVDSTVGSESSDAA
jgi:ParB family chromosome partitioning protein